MSIFSLAAILLPLFPLVMLFLRKAFDQQKIILLVILCLTGFFRQILLIAPASLPLNTLVVNTIFNIAEMVVLVFLLRSVLQNEWLKQSLNFLLVSILSVILTIYSLVGIAFYSNGIEIFLAVFVIVICLIAIWQIIINERLFILHSPVFWIAGGTLSYFAMLLLSETLRRYEPQHSHNTETQRIILLAAVYMVRYIFYIIAAYVVPLENKRNMPYNYTED